MVIDDTSINHTDYSGSDYIGSAMGPSLSPSSEMPTELSSAVVSDSDPPPLPSSKSLKPGLLNFFPTVPSDQAHATWSKRKRENQERDEEEHAETAHQEEEWRKERRQVLHG